MLKIWDSGSQAFRDPTFVRRYDAETGAWVDCQCGQVYKDGSWETVWPTKPQKLVLYDAGTEYVNFTTFYTTYMGGSGGVKKETDKITLTGTTNVHSGVCTDEPISLMPYSKACANVQISSAANDAYDVIDITVHTKKISGSVPTTAGYLGDVLADNDTREKGKIITIEADISKLTVDAYITIRHYYIATGYIYQIWLE